MENNYGKGLYNDGVFYFTNPGLFKIRQDDGSLSGDFKTMWNNKEYIFKAKTTTALVIPNESPENIQRIRKIFAKNYAQTWFHQTPRYKDLVKKGGYMPATYVEDTEFGHVIQQCLTPLPKGELEVKEAQPLLKEEQLTASKAVGQSGNLNEIFKDYEPPVLGQM